MRCLRSAARSTAQWEELIRSRLRVSGAIHSTNQFFAVYDTDRRSIYLMQQRQKKHPLMEIFDGADTNAITSPRPLSTTPLQALFLMNNPFVHQQADSFAVRVGMAYDTLPQRINYAFLLAYGRPAKPAEIGEAKRLHSTELVRSCRQSTRRQTS